MISHGLVGGRVGRMKQYRIKMESLNNLRTRQGSELANQMRGSKAANHEGLPGRSNHQEGKCHTKHSTNLVKRHCVSAQRRKARLSSRKKKVKERTEKLLGNNKQQRGTRGLSQVIQNEEGCQLVH